MRTFLHVGEKTPPDALHPFQGALPVLKLDWQPSVQLLEVFSIWASFANTEFGAGDGVCVAGDVRRGATVVVTRVGLFGLATCFGASTVMPGSWLAGPVEVCDIAIPLRPQSKAVDRIATAEGATKLDNDLMTCPPKSGTEMPAPMRTHTTEIPNRVTAVCGTKRTSARSIRY